MTRPEPPPDSRSRGGSRKGRHLLWGLAFLIAAILIAGGKGLLFQTTGLTGHSLVAITETRAGGEPGSAPRSWIGLARAGHDRIRVLTEEFWSASSPAPSFDGRRFLFRGRKTEAEAPALWERRVDGRALRLVTAGIADPDDPLYLPDGRILFSDVHPDAAPGATTVRSLYTCAPDGTDQARITFGDHRDSRPELLPDGRIRFLRRSLAGPDRQEPIPMTVQADGTGLVRFVPPPEPAAVRQAAAPTLPGDDRRIEEVVDASARRPPTVRTSVVDEKKSTGTLLCLNAYLSDLAGIVDLAPGAIRKVRVSQAGFTGMDSMGRPKPAAVLAEAPVHADGSFFIEVPADTPLQLLLLGDGDRPLASHQHGIWVRPDENRGCIGCHENRELVPEERLPLALQQGAHGSGGPGEVHAR